MKQRLIYIYIISIGFFSSVWATSGSLSLENKKTSVCHPERSRRVYSQSFQNSYDNISTSLNVTPASVSLNVTPALTLLNKKSILNITSIPSVLDLKSEKVNSSTFEETKFQKAQNDTLTHLYKQRYGVRIGGDISRLIRTSLDKNYKGMQAVADFRLTYRNYAAAELGVEEKFTSTDFLDFKTTGTYLKVGVDYNTYNNWYGMENMIFIGGRYSASIFNQDLQRYSINNPTNYWDESLKGTQNDILGMYSGRMAHWLEIIVGTKVELFKNLYVGMDIRLKKMLYNKPDGFPNYWIPGFGRVWEGSTIGVGYNYSITYLIPFFRKKSPKKVEEK